MEELKALLQAGKIKEALFQFRALSEEQQEDFFRAMAPQLFPPSLIALLYRKLKPGKTFDDFYNAWLPPLKEGQKLDEYFPFPTYVLHGQLKEDPSDVVSIGFMWINPNKIEDDLQSYGETESIRHQNIEKVAKKIGKSPPYIVKNVTKLGS